MECICGRLIPSSLITKILEGTIERIRCNVLSGGCGKIWTKAQIAASMVPADELSLRATQSRMILAHMRNGSITPLEALRSYGVERLAARIYDLKKAGHTVTREMVVVTKACGKKTRVASYSLRVPAAS